MAIGWKVIFSFGFEFKHCMYAMMWLKMCRELIKHKEDNDKDLMGYLIMKVREDNRE